MIHQFITIFELFLTTVGAIAVPTLIVALYASRKAFNAPDWDDSRSSYVFIQEIINWSAAWFFVSGFFWTSIHMIKYSL